MKKITILFLIAVVLLVTKNSIAEARDLIEAASTAQTMFNRIGIAAISIGITVGGILYALGLAMIGRMILMSGLIGACAVLGAPAFIALIGRIFGVSV